MNLRRLVPRIAFCLLGTACFHSAHASTYNASGIFAADNSFLEYTFTSTSSTPNYTFQTTSYANGGFDPVLTLFNATTGSVVGNSGPGGADALFSATLAPGAYDLFLTEFPNVAVGNLANGFLFAADPTATGDVCGVTGGMFLDSSVAPCLQRTDAYAFSVTSSAAVAATPEPSSWLLLVSGAAMLAVVTRRQRIA